MMPDTIKVPGLGPTKKTTVYIAGGVLIVAVGIYYYRQRSAAATDTSTTDTTDTGTVDTSASVDPATGYAYGSAEDQAALAQQYGYGSVGSGAGTTSDSPIYSNTGFTSNAQWSEAALQYLRDEVGLDATAVQAALGLYLTGGAANATQAALINQAIAAEGYPPQSGPNGYPPSVRTSAPVTTTPPPSGGGSSAPKKLATPHIYVTAKGKTGDLRVHWNAVPHAGFYLVIGNHGGRTRVSATQHPNFLLKPPSSMHVVAYPAGYSSTGQRVKYEPYLASDPSNTLTARR